MSESQIELKAFQNGGIIVQTLASENYQLAHRADEYPELLSGYYSDGLSEFTLVWWDGNFRHLDLALFGFPSREDAVSSQISFSYTPSDGGTEAYPVTCWFDKVGYSHDVRGDGSSPELDTNRWGAIIISPTNNSTCPLPSKSHNGKYVIRYTGVGESARYVTLNIRLNE